MLKHLLVVDAIKRHYCSNRTCTDESPPVSLLICWLRLNLMFTFISYVLSFKHFLFPVYITVCNIKLFIFFKAHHWWDLHRRVAPIKTQIQLCSSFFKGCGDCWERAEPSRGAEMTGMLGDGGDNLGTGGFGKVHLDCRAMSARHLDSSFTAASHADSTLTWQIHTSHFTPRLFVTGKSQHARCGCVSGVHRVMCVQGCTCVFKCVSVVMNVTVTVPHTARVRQRNAESITRCAQMQCSTSCRLQHWNFNITLCPLSGL